MTHILTGSDEGFDSILDIFSIPDTETGIEERSLRIYKPATVYSANSDILFQVDNASPDYIDVHNLRLLMSYKIVTDKGDPWTVAKGEFCGPLNLATASFFSQCDFELNQVNLNSGIGNNYPFKAYIQTMLSSGLDAVNSFLPASGFLKDQAGLLNMDDSTGTKNLKLRERAMHTENNKEAKLIGVLYCDFCEQKKALINGIPMTIKLTNAHEKFRLMWPNPTATKKTPESYKLEITDMSLMVPFIKLHSGLLLEHAKMLAQKPAVYVFNRTVIKSFAISASLGEWYGQNKFNERIPKKMVVVLVDSLGYAGNNMKNPFNFQPFDLTDMHFDVNSKIIGKPMRLDFPNDHFNDGFISIFDTFLKTNGIPPDIERKEFSTGYGFFCWDFQKSSDEGTLTPMLKGNSRLFVKFRNNLTSSVTVVVLATFDSVVYIDEARNVVLRDG